MDACLSPQKAKEMKEIAEKVRGVRGVHGLRLHKSGPVSFGDMRIEVEDDLPLEKAHEISDEIEKKIAHRFKDVESIIIHVEPAHKLKTKVGIPITQDRGLNSMTSAHFGNAPFFAFVEVNEGQIKSAHVKVNRATKRTRKKGIDAAHFLIDERADVVLACSMGEGPFHLLRDSSVQIYVLPEQVKIKEAIDLLNNGRLEKMTEPIEKGKR
jgi:predicted Fe-Mo cluster-binding NifX family protein